MPTLDFDGRPLEVNEEGFLAETEEWTEDVARFLARHHEGVMELNKDHWTVIHFVRGFYLEHGLAPLIRVMCKKTRFKLKEIYGLFPSGPAQGACKVAGLPTPDGCI